VAIRVHIKPNLPDIPLDMIQGLTLQKFLTTTMTQSRTRKIVCGVLAASLRTAHELKLITDNPMQGVKIPKHIHNQGTALTDIELADFFAAVKGHTLENYFRYLLYTGCRRNEGLSLNCADIDRVNRLLHIRGTKTQGSNRTIPLFENVVSLTSKITPTKEGFYFPFRQDYPSHIFKKYCPTHKLHDLRHTFATICLKAKIPLIVVKTWLGHTEIATTADIYTHVTQEIHADEAARLSDAWNA